MRSDRPESAPPGRVLAGLGLLAAERLRGVRAGDNAALAVGIAVRGAALAGRATRRITAPAALMAEATVVTASRLPGASLVMLPVRGIARRVAASAGAVRADGAQAIAVARADAWSSVHGGIAEAAEFAAVDVVPDIVDAVMPYLVAEVVPRVVDGLMPYLTSDVVPRVVDGLMPYLTSDVVPRVVDGLMPYLTSDVVPRVVDGLMPYLQDDVVPRLVDTRVTEVIVEHAMPVIQNRVLPAIVAEMTDDPRVRQLILEQSRGVLGGATEQARQAAAAADERVEAIARRLFGGARHRPQAPGPEEPLAGGGAIEAPRPAGG